MHIDIVTPTRNRLDYLKENIGSVRASRTAPLDINITHLIHDCGSTDGTADWLRGESIEFLRSPDRVLPGLARNLVALDGGGDFIMPLDDDDILLQRTVHHFIHALAASPRSWAVSDFIRIDSEGRYLPGEDYQAWAFDTPDDMLRAIFKGEHFIQGNVCFRRTLFEQTGGYSTELETAEDLELYVRFLLHDGLPEIVPTVSHLHRVHDRNLSRTVTKDRYNEDLETIYKLHHAVLASRNIPFIPIP